MKHKTFDVVALANTFALIDLVLHPLFRLWIWVSPDSYQFMMKFFVAGWQVFPNQAFDLNPLNLVLSTVLEASLFWILGAVIALLYNKLAHDRRRK